MVSGIVVSGTVVSGTVVSGTVVSFSLTVGFNFIFLFFVFGLVVSVSLFVLQISLRASCALLISGPPKQQGAQTPFCFFKNPGYCALYSFVAGSSCLADLNSNISSPLETFFAFNGIMAPYLPDLALFSVRLTLFFKFQYLGQIYQCLFAGLLPYSIASPYDPGCSRSIFVFSASVNITGCLRSCDGHDLEYELILPSPFTMKRFLSRVFILSAK